MCVRFDKPFLGKQTKNEIKIERKFDKIETERVTNYCKACVYVCVCFFRKFITIIRMKLMKDWKKNFNKSRENFPKRRMEWIIWHKSTASMNYFDSKLLWKRKLQIFKINNHNRIIDEFSWTISLSSSILDFSIRFLCDRNSFELEKPQFFKRKNNRTMIRAPENLQSK